MSLPTPPPGRGCVVCDLRKLAESTGVLEANDERGPAMAFAEGLGLGISMGLANPGSAQVMLLTLCSAHRSAAHDYANTVSKIEQEIDAGAVKPPN